MIDKNALYRIKEYLKQNNIADIDSEKSKMQLRAEGKKFSTEEHLQGMIYSLLSAQTVWANIEKNFANIDRLFDGYNIEKIKRHDADYYVKGLQKMGCGSRLTNAQMKALHKNITTVERIISDYGSMDAFVTSKPQRVIVKMLSSSDSKYKINQMGTALAWEYLRNVGVDGAKPDVHMKRILGVSRLGVSKNVEASDDEVLDTVEMLSKQTGFWMAEIDYLFWAYCATDKGEICTANPHCEKCVIREYCNRSIEKEHFEENNVAIEVNAPALKRTRKRKSSKNNELDECRLKVAEIINDYVKTFGHNEIKHKSEIRKMLTDKMGDLYVMFQEADMCYNKTNKANLGSYETDIILFEACEKQGYFKILGQNYPYTGDVIWTKKVGPNEVVGRWENGKLSFWGKTLI